MKKVMLLVLIGVSCTLGGSTASAHETRYREAPQQESPTYRISDQDLNVLGLNARRLLTGHV